MVQHLGLQIIPIRLCLFFDVFCSTHSHLKELEILFDLQSLCGTRHMCSCLPACFTRCPLVRWTPQHHKIFFGAVKNWFWKLLSESVCSKLLPGFEIFCFVHHKLGSGWNMSITGCEWCKIPNFMLCLQKRRSSEAEISDRNHEDSTKLLGSFRGFKTTQAKIINHPNPPNEKNTDLCFIETKRNKMLNYFSTP